MGRKYLPEEKQYENVIVINKLNTKIQFDYVSIRPSDMFLSCNH